MLVANSPVKRGGGRATDWSRDRSEDTEVSAEPCSQCGWLRLLAYRKPGF